MFNKKSAANTRRYVEIHWANGEGQYGYKCAQGLSVRVDGLRFRHSSSEFRWADNEGSVLGKVEYLSPAEARELWSREFADQHGESFEEAVAAALRE